MKKTTIFIILLLCAFFIHSSYCDYKFDLAFKKAAQIQDSFWDSKYEDIKIKSKYKVIVVVNQGGEYSWGKYFKYAAERQGWEVKLFVENIDEDIIEFDPDFILLFRQVNPRLDMEITAHRSKKYLVLFSSLNTFKVHVGNISNYYPYFPTDSMAKLVKLSHGIITSAKDLDMYRAMFDSLGKPFNGIRMLSTVPALNYQPAEPANLMWVGTAWDKYRNSDDFRQFIANLSNNTSMKVYGFKNSLYFLKNGTYDGFISPGLANIDAIHENGIYLLTNSNLHFQSGEPGMRIFEALAANAVVISDKHPFALENFGNNFLYYDQDADPETMYKQVKAHYDWIKANPEKAKEMAAKAHQIFLQKFTIEQELNRIAKMHEYVVKQDEQMGIKFPLAYE